LDRKFINTLQEYLGAEKTATINDERFVMLEKMFVIAQDLFGDANITLEDDALQMGRMALCIKGFGLTVCGEDDIRLFAELIFNADNFEIYASEDDEVELNIMYNDIFNVTIK
jgi:hypothetical protein